jgi:hypothetical protein
VPPHWTQTPLGKYSKQIQKTRPLSRYCIVRNLATRLFPAEFGPRL